MPTVALHRSNLTHDEIIRTHCDDAARGVTCSPHIDEMSEDPDTDLHSHLADNLAELTGAILDLFENVAVDIEILVAKLVRYATAVVTTRPLIHCDELLDDLYTTGSNGMTTGDSDIDELLAKALCRD